MSLSQISCVDCGWSTTVLVNEDRRHVAGTRTAPRKSLGAVRDWDAIRAWAREVAALSSRA